MKNIISILLFIGLCLNSYSQTEIPKMSYYGRITTGVLAGNYTSISLHVANGISINHVDLGLVLGLETHDDSGYVPILVESRYNFGKGNTKPFIGGCGGYLAALNNYYSKQGGYSIGANIGITHYFTKYFGITTAIGYRFSYTDKRIPDTMLMDFAPYPSPEIIKNLNYIEFRVGISFR